MDGGIVLEFYQALLSPLALPCTALPTWPCLGSSFSSGSNVNQGLPRLQKPNAPPPPGPPCTPPGGLPERANVNPNSDRSESDRSELVVDVCFSLKSSGFESFMKAKDPLAPQGQEVLV